MRDNSFTKICKVQSPLESVIEVEHPTENKGVSMEDGAEHNPNKEPLLVKRGGHGERLLFL